MGVGAIIQKMGFILCDSSCDTWIADPVIMYCLNPGRNGPQILMQNKAGGVGEVIVWNFTTLVRL